MFPVMSAAGRRAWAEETHRRVGANWPAVGGSGAEGRARRAWVRRPRVSTAPAPLHS